MDEMFCWSRELSINRKINDADIADAIDAFVRDDAILKILRTELHPNRPGSSPFGNPQKHGSSPSLYDPQQHCWEINGKAKLLPVEHRLPHGFLLSEMAGLWWDLEFINLVCAAETVGGVCCKGRYRNKFVEDEINEVERLQLKRPDGSELATTVLLTIPEKYKNGNKVISDSTRNSYYEAVIRGDFFNKIGHIIGIAKKQASKIENAAKIAGIIALRGATEQQGLKASAINDNTIMCTVMANRSIYFPPLIPLRLTVPDSNRTLMDEMFCWSREL